MSLTIVELLGFDVCAANVYVSDADFRLYSWILVCSLVNAWTLDCALPFRPCNFGNLQYRVEVGRRYGGAFMNAEVKLLFGYIYGAVVSPSLAIETTAVSAFKFR